ncbi:MAG: DUF58 domain-containing protein [Desulfobacterales bacterium]|nr:DUF58 domain-containing protein [Desulfobacterales bacterium]MBF0397580.1 DUF58 domain-containing protein [Desulfobacterales bacterium]
MKRFFFSAFRAFYIFKIWRRRKFTKAGLFLSYLIIASAILGLDTRQSLTYQLFTLLSSFMILSIIYSRKFKGDFDIKRYIPKFGTAGEPLAYSICINNKSNTKQKDLYLFEDFEDPRPSLEAFLKTSAPFEDNLNGFDKAVGFYRFQWLTSINENVKISGQHIQELLQDSHAEIKIEILPKNRGRLKFSGVTIAKPDPLGLLHSIIKISEPQSIIILPKRYKLSSFNLPGQRRYHLGGIALTSSIGESEEFISLRDYRNGDSLKLIHWKSWARTGKPVVKEYQDEFFVRNALILDTFENKSFSPTFETAVSVAASFVITLENQETLLDLIFIGLETYCFTTGRGLSQTDNILEILADVKTCQDKSFTTITPIIISRKEMLSGCIFILLKWDEERQTFIKHLLAIGLPVMVLVVTDKNYILDPGPMKDKLENFHVLEIDKIQEGLLKL